jgi:uncharacterized repeat protein (TIGR02543 family)
MMFRTPKTKAEMVPEKGRWNNMHSYRTYLEKWKFPSIMSQIDRQIPAGRLPQRNHVLIRGEKRGNSMKKRFLSYFCVLALCLGMLPTTALADAVVVIPPEGGDGDISVVVPPDESGNVTVIVPGEDGGNVVVVVSPDEEEEPEPPAIGDVVNFAGHEWYIIGDENKGVTAPKGYYTLFAKNNDFGSSAFRTEENGGDRSNSTAFCYKDSDLYNRMNEIANGFSDAEKANIFPRTLDNIAGDVVEGQLVWPIGMQNSDPGTGGVNGEAALINQSVRKFDQAYWTRTNFKGGVDIFGGNSAVYDVFGITKDGNSTYVYGPSGDNATTVTDTLAVRPALYVKAEAFTGGAEASPVIGDTVSFAGHEWYLIGTGIGGVTAPAGCYTLFAKYDDFGSTAFRAGADDADSTANHYKDSDLQKAMEEIANSFSTEDKTNIAARATLDGISGDSPADQLLWPISEAEWGRIEQSVRAFPADYWTRTGWEGTNQGVFGTPDSGTQYLHRVRAALADGSSLDDTEGILSYPSLVTDSYAVRPALYVKAEAVGAPKVTESLTGGETYFGNQNWYIVGMGDTGPVPGPPKTVTLFAASNLPGSTGTTQQAATAVNYSEGDLCAAMNTLGASLDLSAQAQSLISSRKLTTEDEITGDSVTTPFWPLSKSEFEAIQAENQSLLEASWEYWLRTPTDTGTNVYFGKKDGTLSWHQAGEHGYNDAVRAAFYLDLSNLFFAAGDTSMSNSVNGNPVKLMPPRANTSQSRWNFVMYDKKNLTLTMSAVQGQSGQSLTFQYSGTGGVYHSLAYVLEQDGVPVYYGNAAGLKDSGSGTVTVPLLDSSSKLAEGDYTMRFFVEDRTDGIFFASNTVDLEIRVANGTVSVTDMGDVAVHTHDFSGKLKYDENNHWRECACGAKTAVEAHTWNAEAATEQNDKHCTVCGYVVEQILQHTHQGVLVPGTPATCTTDGVKDYYECSACHQYFEDADCNTPITDLDAWKVIPETGHTWTATYIAANADEGKHYHICAVCNAKDQGEAHTWNAEAATEQNDKHCTICGYVAEEQLEHTHTYGTEWKSDATYHWHECSCGEKTAMEVHTYGESDTCTICGYVRPAAPEYTVTFNANGGSVSPSSAVTIDGKLTALPIPTRSGYDFVGWYTTASGGQPVSTGTEFTQDTTLYAHWNVREIVSGGGNPSTSGSTTPRQQATDKIEAAKDGDTVEITLSTGNTELDKEVFEELAGRDVTLEINLPGGMSWTVNGQDIPENATLTDLNMGVSMNTSTIPVNLINMVTGKKGTVQMTLAHDGEFGFTMTLTAPVGTENKGLWANLYHYDTTRKQMLFETAAQVDASGNVALKFSHASEYAIVLDTKSHELPFDDVNVGDWFQAAVEYVYRNGIMTGTSATTFDPNVTLSRAMVAQILYNLEDQPAVTEEITFTDSGTHWAAKAIAWAQETGVVSGYEDNTFRPNKAVTREELAQMLYNYAKYKGYDLTASGDLTAFPDGSKVSSWAKEAMAWANGNKLINGHDNGILEPGGDSTRAQAASILMNFDVNLAN